MCQRVGREMGVGFVSVNVAGLLEMENICAKVSDCIAESRRWQSANYLKLNNSKSVFLSLDPTTASNSLIPIALNSL